MPFLPARAKAWLQTARHEIRTDDRYRPYPVYSLLLILVIWAVLHWPADAPFFWAKVHHPWLIQLDVFAFVGALWFAVALGVIGIVRKPVLAKVLSAVGIYLGLRMSWFWLGWSSPLDWLWGELLFWGFDMPMDAIGHAVGQSEVAATPLYALYLVGIWLMVRPCYRHVGQWILATERRIVDAYPRAERFARPLY